MTLNPPVVLRPFVVTAGTWARLPDDGFEVMHTFAGSQAIGAQPLAVKIRRSPPVSGFPGDLQVPPKFRPEESAEQQCSYCEATDRVLAMARILDDVDVSGELFDALVKVAEAVSKRNPLGRQLAQAVLGMGDDS